MKTYLGRIRASVSKFPLASLCVSGIVCAGLTLLIFGLLTNTTDQSTSHALRLPQKDYPLINPLLLCNVDPQKNTNEDKGLSDSLTKFITERVGNGSAQNISAYLIDYKTGQWAGVNENDRYDPASMLKVPLMIAYYQAAEKDPSILQHQVSFNGQDQNTGEYYKSPNDIQPGTFYTIDQLITSMIVNSDNTAVVLLQKAYPDPNSLTDVYTDLGLPVPVQGANVDYISAKLYAYFFRILYNATYLNQQYSEKALELLSKPDIPGIRQGVPDGITVAQKFGERSVYDPTTHALTDRELHDCGIVYKPGSPYLLCVMTRGKDFDLLDKDISDLSTLVYGEIH